MTPYGILSFCSISSDNVLFPWWHQAITWTDPDLSLISKQKTYRKVSNIRRTNSQNLNVYRLIL